MPSHLQPWLHVCCIWTAPETLSSMGTKWNAADISAYEALGRLLYREWDPIGIFAMNGPDDEYQSYLCVWWTAALRSTPSLTICTGLNGRR